jgi:hypothetical protein
MKFSVCLATGYEGLVYPIAFCEPADLIKTAVLCEKLGYDAVWGNEIIVNDRSGDRCVTTLRAKIEPELHDPTYIQTIRDIGYRFEDA